MIPLNRRGITVPRQSTMRGTIQLNDLIDRQQNMPADRQIFDQSRQRPSPWDLPIGAAQTDRFGRGIQLPQPPPQQVQPQQTPTPVVNPNFQNQPVDFNKSQFAQEYDRINSNENKPNKLEYERLVKEGAPEFKISKWNRLASALAGAGIAWGSKDPATAYNLTASAMHAPHRRATEDYERRVKNFSDLAGVEEKDIASRLQGLEAKNRERYNQSDETRKAAGEIREAAEHKARLKGYELDKLFVLENKRDGNSYWVNKETGEQTLIGPTDFTPAEKREQKRLDLVDELKTREPYEISAQNRRNAADKESDDRSATTQTILAGEVTARGELNRKFQAEQAAKRLEARIKTMKPNELMANVLIDLKAAILSGELPPGAAGYITQDQFGMPAVDAGTWGDSDIAASVNDTLLESIRKWRSGAKDPNANTSGLAPDPNGTVTAEGYTVGQDGKVAMMDDKGQMASVDPEDVAELLRLKKATLVIPIKKK